MSLATRCPACGTVFRVVRDQLKVSEGWVRCGRCSEVFSAGERLFELEHDSRRAASNAGVTAATAAEAAQAPAGPLGDGARAATAAADFPAEAAAPAAQADLAEPIAPPPVGALATEADDAPPTDADGASGWPPPAQPGPPNESQGSDVADDDAAPAMRTSNEAPSAAVDGARRDAERSAQASTKHHADDHAHHHADALAEAQASAEASAEANDRTDVSADVAADIAAERAAELVAGIETDTNAGGARVEAAMQPGAQHADLDLRADPEAPPTVPTPGFVLRAERAERWRHPLRRSTMAGLSLLLAATLAGQIAVHYRDGLAATWPASRAWLQALCGRIGCNIEAPMRIDSLAVESSGLVRVEGSDVYQLSLVVRNRAASEVRMPAVDLAVTDPQGQTTARRVLFAAELGQDATSLPAQGEATLQAMLSLGEHRVAGYTVELFYP